ncbi:hypothetical protein ScalyP_jg6538 [Parmales sp. scaly parma]|nr:hypothetical protein ScalyP_jg6538 [Parmales sp. scaly parma]
MFGIGSALNDSNSNTSGDTSGDEEMARKLQQEEDMEMERGRAASTPVSATPTVITTPASSTYFSKMTSLLPSTARRASNPPPTTTTATDDNNNSDNDSDNDNDNDNDNYNDAVSAATAASFATSIAEKLSAGELKSIISMTERLRAKETVLKNFKTERKKLKAEIAGKIKVNDFLVKKMKDSEASHNTLSAKLESNSAQSVSDSEVIAFLDGRVRELESKATETELNKNEIEVENSKLKKDTTGQIKVLEDMLLFERQSKVGIVEDEKRNRSILVREVKAQRSKNFVLGEEVNGLRREIDILRNKIVLGRK